MFLFNEKFPTVTVSPVAPAYPLAALEKMLNYLTFRCCGDELSDELVKNLIPRCRYGRTTKEDLIRFQEIFASETRPLFLSPLATYFQLFFKSLRTSKS